MARKLKSDWWLFSTTLVLVAISIVMVYSASNQMAAGTAVRPNAFLVKQVLFAVLGLAGMFVAMRIDYERYRDPRVILPLVAVTLLALAAVLVIGPEINGTHRWFAVAGVGIQPSELAKLAIILFTAAVLERRMDRIDKVQYALGPIAVVLAPMVGLILLQPDFGSAMALLAIVAAMVFAAGLAWRHIAYAALSVVPFVIGFAVIAPYRVRRLTAFLLNFIGMSDREVPNTSMLREYIVSEAMHALGIPTTRSLAVVATGEVVVREEPLPGAVLTRVASSHIRVGTMEYAAAIGDRAAETLDGDAGLSPLRRPLRRTGRSFQGGRKLRSRP